MAPTNPIVALKKVMRERAQSLRENLTASQHRKWSEEICQKLMQMAVVREAKIVMLYRSIRNEPDVDPLIEALLMTGKRVVLPKVSGKMLTVHEIRHLSDCVSGYKGIREPSADCPLINPHEIDVVILPGTSFDLSGNRLGWGGAYYDRYLGQSGVHAYKVAVAYNFQVLKGIPSESHDVVMDMIVTPTQVLTIN